MIEVIDRSKSFSNNTSEVQQEPKKTASKAKSGTRFKVNAGGIFARSRAGTWEKISSRVEVLAQTRDGDGDNWGRLLKWRDAEGNSHSWTVPMELLIGDPAKVRVYLVRNGLQYISSNPGHRNRLTEYLVSAATEQRIRSVSKVGWSGRVFVLPDRAVSSDGQEETVYQRSANVAHWGTRGSLEEWRENVGRMCSGNSRLLFLASCALPAPCSR